MRWRRRTASPGAVGPGGRDGADPRPRPGRAPEPAALPDAYARHGRDGPLGRGARGLLPRLAERPRAAHAPPQAPARLAAGAAAPAAPPLLRKRLRAWRPERPPPRLN